MRSVGVFVDRVGSVVAGTRYDRMLDGRLVIGIDCAVDARKVGLAVGRMYEGGVELEEAGAGFDDTMGQPIKELI